MNNAGLYKKYRYLGLFFSICVLNSCLIGTLTAETNTKNVQLQQSPLVVEQLMVTNKPLAMLIKQLMPRQLVSPLLSPTVNSHHFQLLPRQRMALSKAKIIIWNGKCLEPFMKKFLQQKHVKHITVSDCRQNQLHWWLNKNSTIQVAQRIVQALVKDFSIDHEYLYKRLRNFIDRMNTFDRKAQKEMQPYRNKKVVFMHNRFHEYTKGYGLLPAHVIMPSHHLSLNTRHWYELKKKVDQGIDCVYQEPQLDSKIVHRLIGKQKPLGKKKKVIIGHFDPLGTQVEMKEEAFFNFLTQLNQSFINCFNP